MRNTLIKEIARYKNRIKAELSFFGIVIPEQYHKDQSYWSNRFMQWLSELKLSRESGTETIGILIDHAKYLRQDLMRVNKKVRELSKQEPYQEGVKSLTSIHGIGIISSMVILTEIYDIHRFSNQQKLSSYVGLTPTSHSSGDSQIHGEMVNRGNKYLKKAIIEAAWVAARIDPGLHQDFLAYCKGMKKNKAIVRIAKKLLNRICFVLKNQVPYHDGLE